jgi:hypothetical protein
VTDLEPGSAGLVFEAQSIGSSLAPRSIGVFLDPECSGSSETLGHRDDPGA